MQRTQSCVFDFVGNRQYPLEKSNMWDALRVNRVACLIFVCLVRRLAMPLQSMDHKARRVSFSAPRREEPIREETQKETEGIIGNYE